MTALRKEAHGRGFLRQSDFSTFLLDASAVDGELSAIERYELGKTIADYCVAHRWFHRVALIGRETAVRGFAELVAPNRGLVVERFGDRRKALEWLNAFAHDPLRSQGNQKS